MEIDSQAIVNVAKLIAERDDLRVRLEMHNRAACLAESERDALRAENEMLRRALERVSEMAMGFCAIGEPDEERCQRFRSCRGCRIDWAISEAGKE